jgi:hypothetical protein
VPPSLVSATLVTTLPMTNVSAVIATISIELSDVVSATVMVDPASVVFVPNLGTVVSALWGDLVSVPDSLSLFGSSTLVVTVAGAPPPDGQVRVASG